MFSSWFGVDSDKKVLCLGGYKVEIVSRDCTPCMEKRPEGTYVFLRHGSSYGLRLVNTHLTACDAVVTIDGEKVGTWRIHPSDSVVVERPVSINRRFIFVEETSTAAHMGQVVRGNSQNGLVSVRFCPEPATVAYGSGSGWRGVGGSITMPSERITFLSSGSPFSSVNLTGTGDLALQSERLETSLAGATVLGTTSDQRFHSVSPITHDTSKITTISLRLMVLRDSEPSYLPLSSVSKPLSTPIPPPRSSWTEWSEIPSNRTNRMDPNFMEDLV